MGSTIKTVTEDSSHDDAEADVFGFLTCVPCTQEDAARAAAVRSVLEWVSERVGTVNGAGNSPRAIAQTCMAALESVSRPATASMDSSDHTAATRKSRVGLMLGDRMINCPTELGPPMYTCLVDEVDAAVEDGEEAYAFSDILLVSRAYVEVASHVDAEDSEPRNKKGRPAGDTAGSPPSHDYHAEDAVLRRFAREVCVFDYRNDGGDAAADSRRAFSDVGVRPRGVIMAFSDEGFRQAVAALGGSGD